MPTKDDNRSLQHCTLQIAMDGSQKIPVRWLPVLREARRRGSPVSHLFTALAVWLRFLADRDEAGRDLPLDDPLATRLRAAVMPGADGLAALVRTALAVEEVFDPDLGRDAALEEELTTALARIACAGARRPAELIGVHQAQSAATSPSARWHARTMNEPRERDL
jgi:fructuronate reductase